MYYEDLLAQKPDMPERRLIKAAPLNFRKWHEAWILVGGCLATLFVILSPMGEESLLDSSLRSE